MTNDTDPHHGQGGSYRVNPDTGERELIERTAEPSPSTHPSPSGGRVPQRVEGSSEPATPKKPRKGASE